MIRLISNDNLEFSTYSYALTRDSKRFMLQQKYQSLDDTLIKPFNAFILSYYVQFINTGEVVIDKEYETELFLLADYMQSIRFDHEIQWQLYSKSTVKMYLENTVYEHKPHFLDKLFRLDGGDIDTVLKAVSMYIIDTKINTGIDVMKEISDRLDSDDEESVMSDNWDYEDVNYSVKNMSLK